MYWPYLDGFLVVILNDVAKDLRVVTKTFSRCRICETNAKHLFFGRLLEVHEVEYFECPVCGYVQTEDPYWLEEAYRRSITSSDTGIMVRNQNNVRLVLATLYLLRGLDGTVVDYAGGYGILVRMLRDLGINAQWADRYSDNLLASGFEYRGGKTQLVTAFEAFEHFVFPQEELSALLEISPNVLISTEIIPTPTPQLDDWWYYGQEHGQHIGFFRVETLRQLASRHGKRLLSDGRLYHLFTDEDLSVWQWRLVRKVIGKLPWLITGSLSPKVWEDHLLVSGKSTRD